MRSTSVIILLGAVALPAARLSAQSAGLLRIDSLLDRSRFTQARTALRQWHQLPTAGRRPDDVAYALALRARLATGADSALAAWLELALAHPSSPYAPQALLRLGQGHFALGQFARAATFLERIPRDYPRYPDRALAAAWLARARRAAGEPAPAAIAAAPTVARPTPPPAGSRTGALPGASPGAPPASSRPGASRVAPPPASQGPPRGNALPTVAIPAPPPDAEDGRYSVQVGAYRARAEAVALTRQLRAEGIPARMVIMPGSPLFLVRAGRYRTGADAAPLLRRLQGRAPAAALVADAHREAGASR